MEKLKIFISWSGPRSLAVAEAHRDWLPNVFQMVEPWVSAGDIDKGAKWRQAITGELEKCDFGLICLTPENLASPWLLFEAGALAKKEESRVCTYLFDVKYEDVKDPLSQFQHTLATEGDTKKLIGSINRALPVSVALASERLEKAFDMWWPEPDKRLSRISKPAAPAMPERTDSDKISEILTRVRALESVVVSREISASTAGVLTIQAEIARRVKMLGTLTEEAAQKRSELGDLSARADELREADGSDVEVELIHRRMAVAQAELQAVEASMNALKRSF